MTPSRARTRRRGLTPRRAVGALMVLVAALAPAAVASAASVDRNGAAGGCLRPLDEPRPTAEDPRMWLDGCGAPFFVDERPPGPPASPGRQRTRPQRSDLGGTFMLESRPGATRTLYLQFTGATLQGTAWNADYDLSTVTVAPFSVSGPATTDFTADELLQIQRTWRVAAEDFAPFDINVTTRPPAPGALERSSPDDATYGATVLVTNGGPLFRACTCGGMAYADVFSAVGAEQAYYQPALVFSGGYGYDIGEAASHEAGHLFGLMHDGTPTSGYYVGRTPWAPIMGASYGKPVTQWSQGEYPLASNQQDDVAIIAEGAPLVPDDHGDTADTATALGTDQSVAGTISSRTDVDAFTFTASGHVRLTATPTSARPDLDIGLRILDASGSTVALLDPAVRSSWGTTSGLDASWVANLPRVAAGYTAVVDGVGSGSPLVAGRYSDYGSMGRYRITLANH